MTEEQIVEGGLDEPAGLEPEQGTLALAAPEDQHSRDEWEAAAAAVLRKARRLGADDPDALVWERLTRSTLDGIGITPLGTPDLLDGLATQGRPARSGAWDIRAQLRAGEERRVNEEALVDLEGGVTSLWVEAGPQTDFPTLLDGVLLDLAPIVLAPTGDAEKTARAFLAATGGAALHPQASLGVDSVEATGRSAMMAVEAGVRGFVVDASRAHAWGASEAQELGYAMALAVDYLRTLSAADLSVDDAARLVEFRFAATDEQFLTIAKLRAARRLWTRVLELCDAAPVDMAVHAVTSAVMMTEFDRWVNILRTTVAAFAAGVGGADSVTVLPFDTMLGRPDALGRRIARNTSHLLVEESHVAKVSDPAGGAYAVERLTDDLARAAWAELGRIETDGMDAFAGRVRDVRERRAREIATRARPITGVSEFPNLAEVLPEREPLGGDPVDTYARPFEDLRRDPPAARVFVATMGPVAAHTARASFATNLFAAGGVAVDLAGATEDPAGLVAGYAGQPVVCLAGTDSAYDRWADEAARALREAGAGWVVVAGRPRASADDSCATGVDALEFLARIREKLT